MTPSPALALIASRRAIPGVFLRDVASATETLLSDGSLQVCIFHRAGDRTVETLPPSDVAALVPEVAS